ncbi:N-acetylmuramoyl-L-alanine amidase family protein [Sphingomonas sp. MMS24-JH45]
MLVTGGGFAPDGRALSLTLRPVDRAGFLAASAAAPMRSPVELGGRKPRYVVSQAVPPPARPRPLPRVQGNDDRPLVVIDAGHGGVDPGAINPETGLREKDVTLKIAQAIRDRLLDSGARAWR